jgi:hypothetical protein
MVDFSEEQSIDGHMAQQPHFTASHPEESLQAGFLIEPGLNSKGTEERLSQYQQKKLE